MLFLIDVRVTHTSR